MNKKRLSVVMAGAMLASSVAPVLAVEKHETTHGNLGLFINNLEEFMNSKKFELTDAEAGKSVYRFQVFTPNGVEIDNLGTTGQRGSYKLKGADKAITLYNDASVLKALNDGGNTAYNYTVKVYELGNVPTENGIISTDKIAEEEIKYTADTFKDLVDVVTTFEKSKKDTDAITAVKNAGFYGLAVSLTEGWVTDLAYDKDTKEVTVTLGSIEKIEGNEIVHKTIKLNASSTKPMFGEPTDEKGRVLATVNSKDDSIKYSSVGIDTNTVQEKIAGFKADSKPASEKPVSIAGEKAVLLHEVKVLNGDINYTVKVDDLYDGFMLTEKGHELMNAIKLFKNDENSKTTQNITGVVPGKGTERYFTVELVDANETKHVVKVLGDSLQSKKLTTLYNWLKAGKADVELLAGTNRYATAVEIAKTYIANANNQYGEDKNGNLVLINGEALVDGLAAAPYAREKEAPILLTAEDKLPKETKAFMKELINGKYIGDLNNKDITVTIIGGEAVVSQSVVNELKEIGFKVKRISGDNREETSLAVADKLADLTNKHTKAFVVGAEGEADAMSIAATAAATRTPIIVSKSTKGLSTVGVNEVSEYTNVEIVGGEGVVPATTEEAIVELLDKDHVTRINGKNRFETNALVIKKYHKGFTNALIAKDGQRNKSELVDALPASLFASAKNSTPAPIVLATSKISDAQLNQLVLNANKSAARTVYQIGIGVNPETVMQVVVKKLGLNR